MIENMENIKKRAYIDHINKFIKERRKIMKDEIIKIQENSRNEIADCEDL